MSIPEYESWLKDPTPDNMANVLNALYPTINSEIQRYTGPKPLLLHQGKLLAIKAIKTYDPTKQAHLRSWVVTQMQPLSRYSQQLKPVSISEVMARQAAEAHTVRTRLAEELGQEPTDADVADEMGISVQRIQKFRQKVRPVLMEQSFINQETGEIASPATQQINTLHFAEDAVYDSLSARDKMIHDWKIGRRGKAKLTNMEIARRLGVTPALVSQRSAQIADMIAEAQKNV